MNRPLQYLNLFGVLTLAVLCVVQWRINRELNLQVNHLEQTRQQLSVKLAEQEKALKGCVADLDDFRNRITGANAAFKESEARLTVAERELHRTLAERDQLKTGVSNWAAAVTAREEQLKQASDQLQKLGTDRNEAVAKFNELAGKYNATVKDLGERTRQFNELVEKFNAAAKRQQ